MTVFGWLAFGMLGVIVLLLLGAMVEFLRQLEQIRAHIGLVDDTVQVGFARGALPPSIEGAELVGEGVERSAVLVLSNSCVTCMDIAQGLGSLPASRLGVVLAAPTTEAAMNWIKATGIAGTHAFALDLDGRLSAAMGVEASPVAVRYVGGRAETASTIPSVRQLHRLMEWLDERPKPNSATIPAAASVNFRSRGAR